MRGPPHIGTRAYGETSGPLFELMRGDLVRAAMNAVELDRFQTREHDLLLLAGRRGVFLGGLVSTQQAARPAAGSPP